MRPNRASDAAAAYIQAVNDGSLEDIALLFHEDAVVINATGELIGQDRILTFYRETVFPNRVSVTPVRIYDAGDTCVVELEGRVPPASDAQQMVDIFTVGGDGRISRMAVYRR